DRGGRVHRGCRCQGRRADGQGRGAGAGRGPGAARGGASPRRGPHRDRRPEPAQAHARRRVPRSHRPRRRRGRARTGGGGSMTAPVAVVDAVTMTRRNLIRYVRVPNLLVFSTVQPVMFVLLFAYVFGGAIKGLPPGIKYIDFLMPGIFVQTVVFGSTQTGVGLADDLSRGMVDRFRSLPMARSAVLAGRTISAAVRNAIVVLLMD